MPTPIPGKFTMDDAGNRVPVYAAEKTPETPEVEAKADLTAPADTLSVEPLKPVIKPKKRSPE